MRGMRIGRRLFAIIATFAIAWGSLWPLVSAAGPKSPTIPSFICTQAGFQPHDVSPPLPSSDHDNFHCPLCVIGADAPQPAIALYPAGALCVDAPLPEPIAGAPHRPYDARPPPSRAPPALS
jgi:hypothetical protein